jgi:2,4-dienoyl-CoA reductase-like NADH-dependent reductase (Old Yellow Enzyme family)
MSSLFSPIQIGNVQIRNRFVNSATYEAMATPEGEVSDKLISRYRILAKGEIGLIISGHSFVHKYGRAASFQTGIHNDNMVPGLRKMVEAVHNEGGKIFLQLSHAGRQAKKALVGRQPMGPSSFDRDMLNMTRAAKMTGKEIEEVITAFGKAAKRSVLAGADGIQLHGAHGYLINQFISPYFNRREDEWGGSDEKRFRFLREIILICQDNLPEGVPLMIKLNTNDYTPKEGITPALAAKYAGWISELGVSGIELSCGTANYSFMNLCRGEVPVDDFVSGLPMWKKIPGRVMVSRMSGKFDLEEGYNIEAAKLIKPELEGTLLSIVGGFRRLSHMNEVVEEGYSDLISMSRPFIREPHIIKRFLEGKADVVSCNSCNRCLAAIVNGIPVRCFNKGNIDNTSRL